MGSELVKSSLSSSSSFPASLSQIVCRSAAFLRDLDLDVEKRRQRLKNPPLLAQDSSRESSLPRAFESFIHVPDILNPVPSSRGESPAMGRKCKKSRKKTKAKTNQRGFPHRALNNNNNNKGDRKKLESTAFLSPSSSSTTAANLKSETGLSHFGSKLRAAGCEWEKFHQQLAVKLSRLKSQPGFQRLPTTSQNHETNTQVKEQQQQQQQQRRESPPQQRRSARKKPSNVGARSGGYMPLMLSSDDDEEEEVFGSLSSDGEYYPLV